MTSGKWLLRSLKRRKKILLDIGAFLVRTQAEYLNGQGPLQPLTLQQLSSHLGLHESTLSRAFAGKYAETPRGFISLRSLVSASPETETAKAALQQLIAHEDKTKPLSDAEITFHLHKIGIKLSRRTIAKYRKALKISPASIRKHVS
jgi:RNA polymerase sigma-54 factor